jgi:hypothetical protein
MSILARLSPRKYDSLLRSKGSNPSWNHLSAELGVWQLLADNYNEGILLKPNIDSETELWIEPHYSDFVILSLTLNCLKLDGVSIIHPTHERICLQSKTLRLIKLWTEVNNRSEFAVLCYKVHSLLLVQVIFIGLHSDIIGLFCAC